MIIMTSSSISDNLLVFLKLGGSLITDKTKAHTPRLDVMSRLASEIKTAWEENQGLQLILGHGSGSFGHVAAKAHGTRQGVRNAAGWKGFVDVWYQARMLNQMVIEAFHTEGLPVITFPVSGSSITTDGLVTHWNLDPIKAALEARLLPVVYGDVAFDRTMGGTILSTEDIFSYLAVKLKPQQILLAGIETGIWKDYPTSREIFPEITTGNWKYIQAALGGSAGDDVTGGMAGKVKSMLALVQLVPEMEARIFSGLQTGNLESVLSGKALGTRILSRS